MYRNLGMALCCIMICNGILIVDVQICWWIFICVLLTLVRIFFPWKILITLRENFFVIFPNFLFFFKVDVSGFVYYWGLYIDVASCIALVLAVGLCVDYAAHVGHIFLTFHGSREERALKTIKYIGTATANGAFSTLLAVALLGSSDAYVFQTFFKVINCPSVSPKNCLPIFSQLICLFVCFRYFSS